MKQTQPIPLSFRVANGMVAELGALPYFPKDDAARLAIVRLVANMCEFEHQLRWLVDRMTSGAIFDGWPGPRELRAVYCSKFRPKDGIDIASQVFLDGIPSERETASAPMLPAGESKQIAGKIAPPDPEVQAEAVKLVAELSDAATMPPALKTRILGHDGKRVDQELRRMMGELPNPPARPPQVITAEDVEEARRMELERRKQAKEAEKCST